MSAPELVIVLFAVALVGACFFGSAKIGGSLFTLELDSGKHLWDRIAAGSLASVLLALASYRLLSQTNGLPDQAARIAAVAVGFPILFYCLALWTHDWTRRKYLEERQLEKPDSLREYLPSKAAYLLILVVVVFAAVVILCLIHEL